MSAEPIEQAIPKPLPTLGRWFEGDAWGDIKRPGERWEMVLDLARDCVTHPARGWSSIAIPDEERPQGRLWDECRALADTVLRDFESDDDPGPDTLAAVLEAIIVDFARREEQQRSPR